MERRTGQFLNSSLTPHSSGTPSHLRNLVNLPDESTFGLVSPLLVSPPSLKTPARPLAGGSSLATPEKKRKGKVSNRGTDNQSTTESQVGEKPKFTPYKLVWDTVDEEGAEGFEYLSLVEEDNGIEVIDSVKSNEKVTSDEKENTSPQQLVNPNPKQDLRVNPRADRNLGIFESQKGNMKQIIRKIWNQSQSLGQN